MEIRRGFRYRLDLTTEQAALAGRTAGCARLVWNLALEQRSMWWQQGRRSVGYAEQCAQLVELKVAYPWLREVPSHTLQQSLRDLDRAFRNFYAGSGRYPRYKRRGRHDAFRFPDPGQIRVKGGHVRLPKLGWCPLRLSRPIQGTIRNATVSWEVGHWYVSFSTVAVVAEPAVLLAGAVGVDVGVVAAATLSTGSAHQVAGWTPGMKRRRLRLERSIARKRKGSANQRRERVRLARLHARARRRRQDAIHKLTTVLAKSHGLVVVEDLAVGAMSRSARGTVEAPGHNVSAKAGLNREILERAWGELRRQLGYKCAERGGRLIAVSAAYSSQECSACGHVAAENRPSQAVFACVACGHAEHADVNAAKVIRQRGIELAAAAGRAVDACGAAA
jgi:putative transposase